MRKTAVILFMTMIISLFGNISVIAENETYQKGDWIYSSETDKIIKWAGSGRDVVIPSGSVVDVSFKFKKDGLYSVKLDDYVPVKSLTVSEDVVLEQNSLNLIAYGGLKKIEFYNNANQISKYFYDFKEMTKLTSLRLPEGMTKIYADMCKDCTALEEIYIPDTVEEIDDGAFWNCESLKTIDLPKNLQTIGENTFKGCDALTSIKLPENVKTIGDRAFGTCRNLTSFEFSSNIQTLGDDFLFGCPIKSLYIPKNIDYRDVWVSSELEKCEFEKEPKRTIEFYQHFRETAWMKNEIYPTIKSDFVIIDNYLVSYIGDDKSAVIPNGVEVIGKWAFDEADITDVKISSSVKTIEEYAFWHSALEELTIPSNVTLIGMSAFEGCQKLAKATFEGDCKVEALAFSENRSLTPENITLLGEVNYDTETEGPADPLNVLLLYKSGFVPSGNLPTVTDDENATPTLQPKTTEIPTEEPTESSTAEPKQTDVPTAEPTEQTTAEPSEQPILNVVSENGEITVNANGKEVDFGDEPPFVDENGRTQIPIRAVAETLDCEVSWDGETQTVTLSKGDKRVIIIIGSAEMKTESGGGYETVTMDTVARIVNDRTYIPVRYAGEALGAKVEWNGN